MDANSSGTDREVSIVGAIWRGTKYVQKAEACLSCLPNLI